MRRWLISVFVVALAVESAVPAVGQTTFPAQYTLQDDSRYEQGCFTICACPILELPLHGTFDLRHTGYDGLFDHYAVENVQWIIGARDPFAHVVGSGEYLVGGEVAIQQQLVLDLSVNGGAKQHFDSGRVSGGGEFPKMDITTSLHQMKTCFDSVFVVRASPAVADVEPLAFGLLPVAPNPFRTQTAITLGLRVAGPVSLGIYDARGRAIRMLARKTWLTLGLHPFAWDGRRDNGTPANAGFYYVRATVEGQEFLRPVVLLR